MQPSLPPGPRTPSAVQIMGWWTRPNAYIERQRAKYGKRFTLRLLGFPPFVYLSDPADIEQVFKMPPEVLHPGEGAKILEPVVGKNSLILLDEQPHLEQRKLLSPALHGKKMQALEGLMAEVADETIANWPRNEPLELHPRLQELTLEIILRAVFGLDPGPRLEGLRSRLGEIMDIAGRWTGMIPQLHRDLGPLTPWRRMRQLQDEADQMIFELIEERRASNAERDDILSMLLDARHEDGSPMSYEELRDELMTLLTAGHETTASELAWAFELLPREPRVQKRLAEEIDAGDSDEYLTATVNEVLRRRPVIPNAEPRLTMEPVTVGDWTYPEGVCLICHAYLVHHDPEIYPDPYAFRPERFLGVKPGTYTWLPFGGGRRRCIGAAFATYEMKVVLKALLKQATITQGAEGLELTRRRAITVSPRRGTPVVLKQRVREPVPA
jgi:cytochrome P450